MKFSLSSICTPKSFTDEIFTFFLIDTDVFCSMILFLFVNDNTVDDNTLKFHGFTIILLNWNHEIAFLLSDFWFEFRIFTADLHIFVICRLKFSLSSICTPKSFTDEAFTFFLIDTDVFCSVILLLFVDDNTVDDNTLKFSRIYNHFVKLKPWISFFTFRFLIWISNFHYLIQMRLETYHQQNYTH